MDKHDGPVRLVTAMPDIEIRDGFMYFCVTSGGEKRCSAYPIHLIGKINREVGTQLAEHFANAGKIVPLDKSG